MFSLRTALLVLTLYHMGKNKKYTRYLKKEVIKK